MIMSVIAQGAPSSNAACVCWCVCWKLQSVQLWCKLPNLCAASRIMCTSSAGMVLTLPADAAWYNHEATSERPMANASDASGVACIAEVHPCFEVLEQVLALYAHKKKGDIRLDLRSLWWGRAKNCPVQII